VLRRLCAAAYDGLVVIAILFAATVPVVLLGGGAVPESLVFTAFMPYLLLIAFAFYGGFWTHGGQTVGLRAWRVRLVAADDAPVSWARAAIRYVAAIALWSGPLFVLAAAIAVGKPIHTAIAAVPVAINMVLALADPRRRMLHDILSGTRLVRTMQEADSDDATETERTHDGEQHGGRQGGDGSGQSINDTDVRE